MLWSTTPEPFKFDAQTETTSQQTRRRVRSAPPRWAPADRADHALAIDALERAVRTLRSIPEHHEREVWLTEALVRLGNQLRLVGHFSAAETALTEARSRADTGELDPVRRAGARNALGILAKDTAHLTAAGRWYAEALGLLEKAFGENDPRLASLQHNVAGLAHARADYVTAEAHARRALELRAQGGHATRTCRWRPVRTGCRAGRARTQ
jgi:tetratricopeptide (TPR) repeat protein